MSLRDIIVNEDFWVDISLPEISESDVESELNPIYKIDTDDFS